MGIDLEKATQLALDHAAHEYRESLAINHVESPDQLPYDFNPEGWELFSISEPNKIGASRYVAVNRETGETRSYAGNDE